jgi:N-methylhydantoinase A
LPSVPLQPIRRERTSAGEPLKGYREVYFPAHPQPVPAAVYERAGLAPGTRLRGPAVVEEPESTTVVGVGCEFEIDEYGGLVITLA